MGAANGIVFFFSFSKPGLAHVCEEEGREKEEEEKYCRDQFTVVRVRCLSSLF